MVVRKIKTRIFDRNIFIMLFAIMIGVIIITYFVADIINKSKIEEINIEHEGEIQKIESHSENFTSNFIRSNVVLDQAREDRAYGNYYFDLAFLWYQSALSEKNITLFKLYKIRGVDNCTNAMPKYDDSYDNFNQAKFYFTITKSYTNHPKYKEVLDLYISLTDTGSKLMNLSRNATKCLEYLLEKLIFDEENGTVTYTENVTEILELLDDILDEQLPELEDEYEERKNEIDEYEFFDEIR